VITGVSGSGKSSLAFDTLYAEGQRRYVESLSTYARQFLGRIEKPRVDSIDGLSPAIAIEQRTAGRNPRSTVGTATEIYDYLRLLYARLGEQHCHLCGERVSAYTVQEMVDSLYQGYSDKQIAIQAPVVQDKRGELKEVFDRLVKQGFVRARVDGEVVGLDEEIKLSGKKKHRVEVIVDRIRLSAKNRARLADSLETALALSRGVVVIEEEAGARSLLSSRNACPKCGVGFQELEPRVFSFNSPYGACRNCSGLGVELQVDPERVVPDSTLSLRAGAVSSWGELTKSVVTSQLEVISREMGFSLDVPFGDLAPEVKKLILYGSGKRQFDFSYRRERMTHRWRGRFEGAIRNLERRYTETRSESIREWIEGFMSMKPCRSCGGARLRPESLSVFVGGKSIYELCRIEVSRLEPLLRDLAFPVSRRSVAGPILKEIGRRLSFLRDVGLDYLSLERSTASLSGGEAQRISLATQIGSGLSGVLYVLDEPSIGLHHRDNRRLLETLSSLRDLGNTVVVVEHDPETILAADTVIDLGPGAGEKGGKVVFAGPPGKMLSCRDSLTGLYLAGKRRIEIPSERRKPGPRVLRLSGASHHNLKSVTVDFPLGVLICVTGVSGSGKSSLITDTLYPALQNKVYGGSHPAGEHAGLTGTEHVDKVVCVDQSPIGRTPRSNPATYTGLFTLIRDLFSSLPESKVRGYSPGRFSFNVPGGRCEACKGDGMVRIQMHFLPDVFIPCDVCRGKRYNRETLEVRYRGRSISDVLEMTVEEANSFFKAIPPLRSKLSLLLEVGLGYLQLGQPATTLSGGEAQRVKLSTELSKRATGSTFYILDEPTTGLHFEDVKLLLGVLSRLVGKGNTVLVIEHNLEVIKTADYVIDLGPEGGEEGGRVVAAGTPEHVAAVKGSHTGVALMGIGVPSIERGGLA